jgi:penicillin amidase
MAKVTPSSLRPLPGSTGRLTIRGGGFSRGLARRGRRLGRPPLGKGVRPRRWPRVLALAAAFLLAAAVGGALWVRSRLTASLPQLAGEARLAGLGAPVTVERDALGVPTLRAASRLDAARALGFVHAQDRFFQMDLLRRQAAGELAELFGPKLVAADRRRRVHRFRAVADLVLAQAAPAERAFLDAYCAGVNAGLAALGGRPFEYQLLRATPAPWRPADSLLVTYSMFLTLNDETGGVEASLGRLHERVPPALFAFLAPIGTEWDAPLFGQPWLQPPVPGPDVFDLRTARPDPAPRSAEPPATASAGLAYGLAGRDGLRDPAALLAMTAPAGSEDWHDSEDLAAAGSNNWAVAGSHTADGHALLANDMHLSIGVPNTWYRVAMLWPAPEGGTRRLVGVSLPGAPAVVVGSNGSVAWGFTNSYGDYADLVDLEPDGRDPETYRTPAGPRRYAHHMERIQVRDGQDEVIDVRETIWGPVTGQDEHGRPRALAWTAHHPEAVNLKLVDLEDAKTVTEAIAAAHRAGIPPQNFTVADSQGHIGWTIIGKVPRRIGFDGRLPSSWADGSHRWEGWLDPAEMPRLVDPPAGRIWTANARVVDGEALARLGDGGYALGARARQIRDRLLAIERATPADMLAVQLDDRALLLERWRGVLLRVLASPAARGGGGDRGERGASGRGNRGEGGERGQATPPNAAGDRAGRGGRGQPSGRGSRSGGGARELRNRVAARAELRRMVERGWTGRAEVGSVAYRAVHDFREVLAERVWASFGGGSGGAGGPFFSPRRQFEGPLWALVTARPQHLLDPRYRDWDQALVAAADAVLERYQRLGEHLAERTWGERNTSRFQHPLSLALPVLGRFLDMPAQPLPGDENMPRVQSPHFGASERLAVSPGHEGRGYFEMPGGESGHPLSPHYRDQLAAWEQGRPTPFLPGPAVTTLRLVPGS